MDHNSWIRSLFQAVDSMDAGKFVDHVTDNAHFKFGNAETVSGKPAIQEAVADFYSSIARLSHDIQAVAKNDGAVMCKGEVTYTRKDSTRITLPFANFFGLENDLVKDYQIYIDISPLYSPSGK